MYTDPDEDLARTRRKDIIKTALIVMLFIVGGIILLNMLINDMMH
ncbi:hypothetical protein [Sphingomonas sp. SRS2]|nr:hypothetical protein [Sphingomonas sp. SRS2]